MSDYFEPGQWNAICDRCGRKVKSAELRRTWQGFMVCAKDWEPRHPQDFVKGVPDNMTPAWVRPPPIDIFVFDNLAIAGIAIGGKAVSGVSS